MHTHPVWEPLLLCSKPRLPPPGDSPRGNSTRGNALWVPQGNRATGCREEGRGATHRQPLPEAWLGSTTGLTGPRAVGLAATAENRQPLHGQCHRSRWSTGSRAGIVRQRKAISPPL